MMPIALQQTYGLSATQIGYLFTVVGVVRWVVDVVLVLLVVYVCARHRMDWFMFLMSPGGRASRAQFWLGYWIPFVALGVIAGACAVAGAAAAVPFIPGDMAGGDAFEEALRLSTGQAYMRFVFLETLAFWPWLAVNVKRLHDRGKSGWFLLILLIPVLGALWLIVEVWFLPGQRGANRFGPDPREA